MARSTNKSFKNVHTSDLASFVLDYEFTSPKLAQYNGGSFTALYCQYNARISAVPFARFCMRQLHIFIRAVDLDFRGLFLKTH